MDTPGWEPSPRGSQRSAKLLLPLVWQLSEALSLLDPRGELWCAFLGSSRNLLSILHKHAGRPGKVRPGSRFQGRLDVGLAAFLGRGHPGSLPAIPQGPTPQSSALVL